jgi:hypothetical protein
MRAGLFFALAIFFLTLVTSGQVVRQDWQHCQSDGAGSFEQVKESVRGVTSRHGYTGWDEKLFSRFGDMTSVAILQTLTDDQLTTPQTLRDVLLIVRFAFGCPSPCVVAPDDRNPRVTLLLLDELHNRARGPSQLAVDEVKRFVIQQVQGTD